jgi:16S rRNA (guanine(966)-N(2))-methyltransferase RsmD
MRIIAGSLRSRALTAPPGLATRPTSGRLRETLFNVLAPRIRDAVFLDLYAGSGAVGIEALSRGATSVTFVERAPAALKVLRANLARLGLTAGFRIHPGSVGAFLRLAASSGPQPERREKRERYEEVFNRERHEVVFLDPPYDAAPEYAAALGLLGGASSGLLAPGALVIAEHRSKVRLEDSYGNLKRTRLLEQGDAALSFYAVGSVAS